MLKITFRNGSVHSYYLKNVAPGKRPSLSSLENVAAGHGNIETIAATDQILLLVLRYSQGLPTVSGPTAITEWPQPWAGFLACNLKNIWMRAWDDAGTQYELVHI